jgi:hypothetical protein
MKNIIILFLIVFCFAFNRTKILQKEIGKREFKIDTIKTEDKKHKFEVFLTIPISGISNLDSIVRNDILNEKNWFEEEIKERIAEDDGKMSELFSDYNCGLLSLFEDKKFISYSFTNSQYFAGAAHGMTRYISYNYELKRNKLVIFNEFFNLKSEKDSIFLMNLMTRRIALENVEVNTFENMDFNLTNDSISFNFDDYEIASYAEGAIQVKIGKNEIANLINKNYR